MAQQDTDQYLCRVAIRKTTQHMGTATDLAVQSLNNIVGVDASSAFVKKLAVSQHFLNATLHLFVSLFQLHKAQLPHHCFGPSHGQLSCSVH